MMAERIPDPTAGRRENQLYVLIQLFCLQSGRIVTTDLSLPPIMGARFEVPVVTKGYSQMMIASD